jgi:hypothetical protein
VEADLVDDLYSMMAAAERDDLMPEEARIDDALAEKILLSAFLLLSHSNLFLEESKQTLVAS